MTKRHPALFLDRDGVVNEEIGFAHRPEQISFVPGVFELMRLARDRGYRLVIITNQSGIARGLYGEEELHALMCWMTARLGERGIPLDGYYFCPHHPEATVERFRLRCDCRKPAPGMLLRAAADLDLDLTASILIGDRCSDIAAGAAAGVGRLFLLAGTEPPDRQCEGSYRRVSALTEILDFFCQAPVAQSGIG